MIAALCRHSLLGSWLILQLGILAPGIVRSADVPTGPTVGMEGRVEVLLPGPALEARPVSDRSAVVVRVAEAFPHGTLTRYDLRYVGLRPGSFDLAEYLIPKDGSAPTQLPAIPVHILGILPADHSGQLVDAVRRGGPSLGGYRTLLAAMLGIWIAGWIVWFWRRRARPAESVPEGTGEPPSLADRMRPLVEAGTRGELDLQGQARLERLLLGHWRARLGWEELPMDEALGRLRQHPEAGRLLRDLEAWLHQPRGTASVDVAALLAPYRDQAPPQEGTP